MHEKAIAALVERVKAIAETMVYPIPLPYAGQKIIGGPHPASSFALTEAALELRDKLIAGFLYVKWSDRFSEKFIEGRIADILLKAAEQRDTSTIEAGVQELVAEYESFDTEYLVIMPLVGVSLKTTATQLGRVTLRNYDDAEANELRERCRSIMRVNPNYSAEWKADFFRQTEQEYLAKTRGRTCSEVVVKAEPKRAKEFALEETRLALDLLRYAILFLFADERPRAVGVLGDVTDVIRMSLAIRTDNTQVNYGSAMQNHPLNLDDQTIARMRAIGVFELSDLITKPNKNEFEDVILRAVHWLASAQTQNENENALLNLMTCLETFFKAEAGTPITVTISEGVAMMTTSGLEERKRRKRRMVYFYGKRSKLTHEGDGRITNAELLELTVICRDLTLLMIRNKSRFIDHKQFRQWLEDQKLGASVSFPVNGPESE